MTPVVDAAIAREFWALVLREHPGRARIGAEGLVAVAAPLLRGRGIAMQPIVFVTHAVRVLAGDGALTLPSDATAEARRSNYDERCTPPIPRFVTASLGEPKPTAAPRREHPWHPDLGFLASERRLMNADVWLAIDAWLKKKGNDTDVMSMRERSVEIFGDEKKLDDVRGFRAFRAGDITLERLRCEVAPEPLAARLYRSSAFRKALVIENKDTFRSACVVNAEFPLYAAVIFGEGSAFPGRVGDLANLAEEVAFDQVDYFGDIDAEGFRIPRRAEREIRRLGLRFSFSLARDLYRLLLATGQESGRFGGSDSDFTEFLSDHGLPELDLSARNGGRIPQEALGRPALREAFLELGLRGHASEPLA